MAVELLIRIGEAYIPVLSIPHNVCYRFALEPLRWLRFLGYVIYGAEGDISTTADGPPVDYHSALEDAQYYHVSLAQSRLLDVNCFNDRVSDASTTSSRVGFREKMKERDEMCIFSNSIPEGCEAAHIFPHSKGSKYMRRAIAYRGGEGLGIDEINHLRNGVFLSATLYKLHAKGFVAFLKTPNFALDNDDIPPSPPRPGPPISSHGRFILQYFSESLYRDEAFVMVFPHNLNARLPDDMEEFPHSIITDMVYGSAALNAWGVSGAQDAIIKVLGSTNYDDVEPDNSDQEEEDEDIMKEKRSPIPRPESPSTSKRKKKLARRERKLAERSGMDRAMECISMLWMLSSPKPQEQPSLSEEREVREERLNEWLKAL